jgi:hypothetical protein
MFDFLAEILVMLVIAAIEVVGEILFEGVFEAIARIPVIMWNTVLNLLAINRHHAPARRGGIA